MGCEPTDVNGKATFCYTVYAIPGKDVIYAWIETNCIFGLQRFGPCQDDWCSVEKYWLDHRITGGGNINTGRGRDVTKITFGGNVGIAGGEGLVGQWNINFHNLAEAYDEFDKGHFHSEEITFLDFKRIPGCGGPVPPDAYFTWAQFKADGRFKVPDKPWEDGWSIIVNVADFGEGKNRPNKDSIRILLYDNFGGLVFDSWWEFGSEDTCGPLISRMRAQLDGGNIQMHRVPPFSP